MNRYALAAAVLGLATGAAGCSSASSGTAPGPSGSAAAASAAVAGSGADQVCSSTTTKLAEQAMAPEKDAMNQTLASAGSAVRITSLTADGSCYLVLRTDAKAGDAKAGQALAPLEQGFSEALTGSSPFKGVKVTATDGSVLYQVAAGR